MFSRPRTTVLGGVAALAIALLPAGTAVAQSLPPVPSIPSIPSVPPVPPVPPVDDDTQVLPLPGGSLVQGPAGQTFVPDGFVLAPTPDGEGQQTLPE